MTFLNKISQKTKNQIIQWYAISFVSLGVLLIFLLVHTLKIYSTYQKLKKEYRQFKLAEIEQNSSSDEPLFSQKNNKESVFLLHAIVELLPDTFVLDSFAYSSHETKIQGRAPSLASVSEYANLLRKKSGGKHVTLAKIDDEEDGLVFQLILE